MISYSWPSVTFTLNNIKTWYLFIGAYHFLKLNTIFVYPVYCSEVSSIYGQAASNLLAGNILESTIQQILEMGGGSWDRDTVIRALRAAFNNPERAVEYLYSVSLCSDSVLFLA